MYSIYSQLYITKLAFLIGIRVTGVIIGSKILRAMMHYNPFTSFVYL